MKVKIFIITYNNEIDLNNNLNSLFNSDIVKYNVEINIINNHSNFNVNTNFLPKINILHNNLRPNFSTGHLARNWNQSIINGFKNLNNPDCDLLIHCQDDTIFDPNWLSLLIDLHNQFEFIQFGIGDHLCSYKAEAIKKVGLWDERFCGIGYQEADYFLRCLIYNKEYTCINDMRHGRLLNAVNFDICYRPVDQDIFSEAHKQSMNYHPINRKIFEVKWGISPENWSETLIKNPPIKSNIHNFIMYPYFESNIDNLLNKNYII